MKNYGTFLFRLGIFLLPSAFFISSILLTLSLIISFFISDLRKIFTDKLNLIFFVASVLMIIICILQFFIGDTSNIEESGDWNKYLSWIGLGNWIPLFLCFWGFQIYLINLNERKITAKFLIAGSIPVLVSGFGQYFFDWHGPINTLNELIVWYQRPLISEYQGLSGLFNNQNYAGCWLNIILPFSIAILFESKSNIFKKGTSVVIAISISLAIFLTSSRSAWSGLLLTFPLLFGTSFLYWFLPLILSMFFIIFLNQYDFFPQNIQELFNFLKFENIVNEFQEDNYTNVEKRSKIFLYAIKKIIENPILGLGAGSFPIFYLIKYKTYIGHTHNLFLELTFNYGIIVSSVIFINILVICYLGFVKIYVQGGKNNFFEKAWFTSFFVLICSQMVDIEYFDGRISIIFWVLLAGIKNNIKVIRHEY